MPFVSGALMDPISKDFVRAIHRFIDEHELDLVHFQKGESKDDIAKGYLASHDGSDAVLFVGRAQEKARVYRTEKCVNPSTGKAYPWLVITTALPNHFYFYGNDSDFGPFFIKFGTFFPYTRSSASTDTTMPSARRPRPASTSKRSTTASSRVPTSPASSASATT